MTKTSLYRHFDKEGRLLYVGISHSFMDRLAQHKSNAHWFWDIRRVDVVHYPNRAAALRAEARAIRSESPLHNLALPPSAKQIIDQRVERFGRGPSLADLQKPEPSAAQGHCFGYLRYMPKDDVEAPMEAMVNEGVSPGLIFSDRADDPESAGLLNMLRHMQSPDAVLVCDRVAHVAMARSLFRDRGQTVKDISGRVWIGRH